jgi:DNA repair protein RadC
MYGFEIGSAWGENQFKSLTMKNTDSVTNYESFEFQVTYNRTRTEQRQITSSKAVFDYLKPLYEPFIDWREYAYLICLDRANNIIGHYRVSEGGISGTVMDAKIILGIALKAQASGIILSHNHPSGNLQPSNADLTLTKKIKEACKLLDIALLDHLIMVAAPQPQSLTYYSFADEGVL